MTDCKHPPSRYWSWFAYNAETGKRDVLCVACCDCGHVLAPTN